MGALGAVGGRSSPWSKPCTPIAVPSWGPSRPCTRVCAVVMGGRKMVALSPLGDLGAVSRAHSPGRTGLRILGSLLGEKRAGRAMRVSRVRIKPLRSEPCSVWPLVGPLSQRGWEARSAPGWPWAFLWAQGFGAGCGPREAAAGGDLHSPVERPGGKGIEDTISSYLTSYQGVNPGFSPLSGQGVNPALSGGSLAWHLCLWLVGVMLGCLP